MNTISQRDQLFQAAQDLSFDDLKHLCQTNRDYRTLCAEQQFQDLIRKRFDETTQGKVRNILNQINGAPTDYTLRFQLVNPGNDIVHYLGIYKNYDGEIQDIKEFVFGFPMESSVIYQLFKKLANFKGIENYTPEEYRKVAESLYEDDTKLGLPFNPRMTSVATYMNSSVGKYLLLEKLMRRYNDSQKSQQRKINVEQLGRVDDTIYTIEYPTQEDLRIIFTYALEQFPNTRQLKPHEMIRY